MRICSIVAGLLLALSFSSAMAQDRPQVLRIGLLPGESAPTVIRLNERLRVYLEETLDLPVELHVGGNYGATGEALRFARIDIAYLGPLTYVLQRARSELYPFAKPYRSGAGGSFNSAIIVPSDSTVEALEDLRGHDIAFGDPASTSGTWVPQFELLEAGLIAGRDYRARHLGGHDAVAFAVANGRVAAGGISKPVLDRLLAKGIVDPQVLRILFLSRPIPEYAWTFRAGLDPAFMEEVAVAFLRIDDANVLSVFSAESFTSAKDADFAVVRGWIEALKRGGDQ